MWVLTLVKGHSDLGAMKFFITSISAVYSRFFKNDATHQETHKNAHSVYGIVIYMYIIVYTIGHMGFSIVHVHDLLI
jgi:hypothetical protein